MCDGNADLEKEFEEAVKAADKEMAQYLKEASEALQKAKAVSEKYGVPFTSSISPLRNGFIPKSFQDKFGELDHDFVSDVSGVYDEYGDFYPGWIHSAVC